MNNDSGNNGAQLPDERLIAAYRNASDETVPEHLDARVLHDAKTAAQASAKVGVWNYPASEWRIPAEQHLALAGISCRPSE